MAIYYTVQPLGAMRQCLHMVPESAGVYMMLLDQPDALEEALSFVGLRHDPLSLGSRPVLYIGTTTRGMRTHMCRHLAPRSSASAFRMGIGAVLSHHLGLEVGQGEPGPGFDFSPASEKRLSDWLDIHVSVAMRIVGPLVDTVVGEIGDANETGHANDGDTFETKGLLVHSGAIH